MRDAGASPRRGPAAAVGLVAAAALLAACDRIVGPPTSPVGFASVPLVLTAELAPDVPTFKVDGRLRLVWEFADQPVGGSDLGTAVLPAGQRRATFDLRVPARAGHLVVREETFTPQAPFLCGSTGFVDPRETETALVILDLCQPG